MAGPWEDYQNPGPWTDFQPKGPVVPTPQQASTMYDAWKAGLQDSSTGLAVRGKMPEQVLGEDAPWYMRLAKNAGAVLGDIPAGIAGAAVGSRAGPVGAFAGGFAAPMALREGLITAYQNDFATSWEGFTEIATASAKAALKGAVIGAATAGGGKVVGPLLEGASPLVKGAGVLGAELAAMTTTAAALEGHMPTWQDFMDNALLLGGLKGAVGISGRLMTIYRETGKRPEEVVADARLDEALRLEILQPNRDTLVAEQRAALDRVSAAEAAVTRAVESDASYRDVLDARKEAREAQKVYDALTNTLQKLPDAYLPRALEERIRASLDADARPEQLRVQMTQGEPPRLGTPPQVDPVKYEYITDQDTLKGTLRLVENMYRPEIEAQTRGVQTNKETASQAMRLVANGELAEHVIGAAENAEQLYARAHVLKGVTEHAYRKVVALKDVRAADMTPAMKVEALAALEQLSMVTAEFRGARAEAGRALQIFNKIKRDSAVLGDAEALVKLAERKGSLQDVAAMVAALKDPAQLQRVADTYTKATTLEKVLEGWKAAILSGPQTHLANVMGNAVKWAIEVPESILSATITAGMRAAKGDPLTMAQYKARALAPILGIQHGAMDALKVVGEVWRGQGEHLEKADVYRTAIKGKKGEIIRLPFKALQMEDALFRTVAEKAEAYKMAVDRAAKEGLDPRTQEGREAVAKWTDDPTAGLSQKAGEAALAQIQQVGAEGVFSQRLGPRMETVQRALAGSPVSFIIPFFRTPVNLLSWTVQHAPGLNMLSARWRNDFMAGGEKRAQAVARVTVGSALALTAYSFAQDGGLTGGGMTAPEEKKTKAAAGWQPYSLKIGDKYYSYQRLEPVGKLLGLAADLNEILQATKDEEDKAKIVTMLAFMFGNATVSTTYMSGLNNAMNAVTDPQRYGEQFLEQYASSAVPRIIGQTAAMVDPYKREVDGVLDSIIAQIPYMREKLLPQRDVWGEPVRNDKWFEVMPVQMTQASQDKVRTEAVRLQLAIQDAPRFITEKGPFKPGEQRIELTDEQRDIYKQVAGKNAMTILAPIVNAEDWERIPDFAKAAIYKKVIEGTRKQGQYAALPPDEEGRVKMREKIVNEIIKQQQEVEGK